MKFVKIVAGGTRSYPSRNTATTFKALRERYGEGELRLYDADGGLEVNYIIGIGSTKHLDALIGTFERNGVAHEVYDSLEEARAVGSSDLPTYGVAFVRVRTEEFPREQARGAMLAIAQDAADMMGGVAFVRAGYRTHDDETYWVCTNVEGVVLALRTLLRSEGISVVEATDKLPGDNPRPQLKLIDINQPRLPQPSRRQRRQRPDSPEVQGGDGFAQAKAIFKRNSGKVKKLIEEQVRKRRSKRGRGAK